MNALDRLLAIQEIEELITRCCMLSDDRDWATLATLWTDDAEFGFEGGEPLRGKQAVVEFVTTGLPHDYVGKHLCSRSLVELAPDGASAEVKTAPMMVGMTIISVFSKNLCMGA